MIAVCILMLLVVGVFGMGPDQELYVTEGDDDEEIHEDTEVPVLMLAVSGGRMTLPCDIISSMEDDEVYLVLWYKDEIATPIYSIDARRGRLGQARHASSEELAGRAYFNSLLNPAVLEIDQISTDDEGLYRCRVDFRKARTRHSAILLRVVVPPSTPIIKDYNGEVLTGIIGPYNEGESLHLICETQGGKPEPTLSWWKGRKIIDDSYEETSPGIIRNELTINKLQRKDLLAIITCRAANNKISPPVETSVTLDMNFRPLSVNVRGKRRRLSAKKTVQFECDARGSRPPAVIMWRKGSTKLKTSANKISGEGNVTTSVLSFTPTSEDNGKFLYCQADNPVIPGSAIEDGWKLEVHYVPQLTLRLGSKLRYSNIVEGNDVYFECNIRANPWVSETGWKFEGKEMQTNLSAGVIVSNQSLVLQKVQRLNRGRYSCTATNTEGTGESNHVYLRVQYSPVCKPGQEIAHGAMLHYPVKIPCEVEADPDDVTFHWEFNSSSRNLDLIPTYTSGTKSLVNYIPRSEMDFGTLFCFGRNSVGQQKVPCTFYVNPAETPSPVHNCSVYEETERSFRVSCSEGRDGGLNQYFYTEIRDISSRLLLKNVSAQTPDFVASGLTPGTVYIVTVYANNAKGRSEPTVIRAATLAPPESQTRKEDDWDIALSPLLLILCGVVAGLVLVAVIVILVMKIRINKRRKQRKGHALSAQNEKSAQGSEKSGDTCSEGCTCAGRDEEKFRENIPDVVVFSEKVKPGDEETISAYQAESAYWNRIDAPTAGTRGTEYIPPQIKMKLQGGQSTSWTSSEWIPPASGSDPMSLQYQNLEEEVDRRALDQRHAFPLQPLPTIEETPASPTILTALSPQAHQQTIVTARQTDV